MIPPSTVFALVIRGEALFLQGLPANLTSGRMNIPTATDICATQTSDLILNSARNRLSLSGRSGDWLGQATHRRGAKSSCTQKSPLELSDFASGKEWHSGALASDAGIALFRL